MINIKSKLTKKLANRDILKICKLKNSFWKYGIKSNYNWFKENIKKNDLHILLLLKNSLIGYGCLRKRTFLISKKRLKYFYFDTLIINSKYRGKNFGHLLQMYVNNIIQKNDKHGFLLCVDGLVNYHKKFSWIKLKKKKFMLLDHNSKLNGMVFNLKKHVSKTRINYKIFT